ncbi:MAG: UbiA family prenyltransferase [Planctomycetes bacterium]|nr:UbiA family prenyltransferase [Planctomycetota bacterium]
MENSAVYRRALPARDRFKRALRAYWQLSRPFTLLAPSLGMLSGGLVALFARGDKLVSGSGLWVNLILGALGAALLNAASNAINQVYDLSIDRINKPGRPMPRGDIKPGAALAFCAATTGLALVCAVLASYNTRRLDTVILFGMAAIFSWAYSAPPLRMRARGWLANLTVAIPRGTLLKVAGWSLVQSTATAEAWYIGAIMGLFLLGATSTKDFSDIRGDEACGVKTLPIIYGPRAAASVIAPFLVLPFLLIPYGAVTGVLTGRVVDLVWVGLICTFWGLYIAVIILRDPDALTRTENHPAWRQMYYLMLFVQVGFVLAYVPHDAVRRMLGL